MNKKLNISKKKASKAVNDSADFATDNWKPLLILLGIGVGVYAVSKITSNALEFNFGDPDGSTGGSQTNTGTNTPFGASITQNQAQNIAAALYTAMNYQFGTNEERIFSELEGKNGRDYSMISNAFGTPRYDGFAMAPWPFPERSLTHWLNTELTQNEINKLKQLMPGVL
jgi:hypothetical protein